MGAEAHAAKSLPSPQATTSQPPVTRPLTISWLQMLVKLSQNQQENRPAEPRLTANPQNHGLNKWLSHEILWWFVTRLWLIDNQLITLFLLAHTREVSAHSPSKINGEDITTAYVSLLLYSCDELMYFKEF